MFSRRPRPGGMAGVHTETAVVADPDKTNISRWGVLALFAGRALDGQGAGTRLNYDRGDPGRTLQSVVVPLANPTTAVNNIAHVADASATAPVPEFNTQGGVSAGNDGTGATWNNFFNRIYR